MIKFLFLLFLFPAVAFGQKQFVLITMDDMRPDDMRFMPKLQKYFEENGKNLDRAFNSCPLCCPSRATLMTGLFAQNHGVTKNTTPLSKKTIFEVIKEQKPEIKTGMIGKYLNSYNGEYKSEFDLWAVYKGRMIYNWFNFLMNINGTWTQIRQYVSDYYLGLANTFVQENKDHDFVLYLHFTAPHYPYQTPSNFEWSCAKFGSLLPRKFNRLDPNAPKSYRKLKRRDKAQAEDVACKRARSIAYIDSKIIPFLDSLNSLGIEVIFLSDNGIMLGDYRQISKGMPYEQVIRSPFLTLNIEIEEERLTSFVDVATNLYYELDLLPPYPLDGLGYELNRDSVLVESYYDGEGKIPFIADVSRDLIDVHYLTGETQKIQLK